MVSALAELLAAPVIRSAGAIPPIYASNALLPERQQLRALAFSPPAPQGAVARPFSRRLFSRSHQELRRLQRLEWRQE